MVLKSPSLEVTLTLVRILLGKNQCVFIIWIFSKKKGPFIAVVGSVGDLLRLNMQLILKLKGKTNKILRVKEGKTQKIHDMYIANFVQEVWVLFIPISQGRRPYLPLLRRQTSLGWNMSGTIPYEKRLAIGFTRSLWILPCYKESCFICTLQLSYAILGLQKKRRTTCWKALVSFRLPKKSGMYKIMITSFKLTLC